MRRAIFLSLSFAIVSALSCKKSETTKDDDISAGRKPIAAAGGTKGASKKLEADDDDDDHPSAPKGPTLDSKQGRFHVDFPVGSTLPSEKLVPVPTAVGTVLMHNFMNESVPETVGTSWVDYPPGHVLRNGGASLVLKNVENGSITAMFATVDRDAEIKLSDGRIARDFTFVIAGPPATYGRQLATFDGDRLYQLIFTTNKGASEVDSPRVRAFFASLRID